jgi:hypothetical protein
VHAVDENLIVLRTSRRPTSSTELAGFHLYGADTCLHARRNGSTVYVIDFRVQHLSAGKVDQSFATALQEFGTAWGRKSLRPGYVHTPIALIPVGRWRWMRWLLARRRVAAVCHARLAF